MRILHLALDDHARPGSGDGSRRVREVNIRLAALGHDVDVVTANYPGARPRLEDWVRYRQRGLRHGAASRLLSHQACLPRVVTTATRRTGPDLIVEELAPFTSSLGIGHWTRAPTVGIAHGFFAEEPARRRQLPARLPGAVQRWGTRGHDQLIASSDQVAERLRAAAPAARVSVIPAGVDCEAADRARGQALRTDGMLLFLGALDLRQPGLDVLIAAMEHVSERIWLVIAGEGRDRHRIERDIRARGLADRISLIDPVSGEDRWHLLATASVLVAPSRRAGTGMSLLEAMACGTPVIASDRASLRERVPAAGGQIVAGENPRGLAEAINQLIAAPERRRRMGAVGVAAARDHSWDTVAEEHAELYASILERSRAGVGAGDLRRGLAARHAWVR